MAHHAQQSDPTKQPQLVSWASQKAALTGVGPALVPYLTIPSALMDSLDAQGTIFALIQAPPGLTPTNQYIMGVGGGTSGWRLRLDKGNVTYVNSQPSGGGYAYAYEAAPYDSRRLVELHRNGSHVHVAAYDLTGAETGYTVAGEDLVYIVSGASETWVMTHQSNTTRFHGLLRTLRFYPASLTMAQRAAVRAEILSEDRSATGMVREQGGETYSGAFDGVPLEGKTWFVERWDHVWDWQAAEQPPPPQVGQAFKLILSDDGIVRWESLA